MPQSQRQPMHVRHLCRAACLAVLWFIGPSISQAQTRTITSDGLTLSAEWWSISATGGGYCPVRVRITNMTPRSRSLEAVIESSFYPGSMYVSHRVELEPTNKPGGASSADLVMSLPITSAFMGGTMKTYERGRELKKLNMFGIGSAVWWGSQVLPTVGHIGRATPDTRNLAEAISKINYSALPPNSFQPVLLKPQQAPTKWIDYTMLDLLVISASDIDQLSAASREAIAAWAMAGGNLFVYGLGENRQSAPELRLLDVDRRMPRGAPWRLPRAEDRNVEPPTQGNPQAQFIPGQIVRVPMPVTPLPSTPVPSPGAAPSAEHATPHFSIRAFGFGQLVACDMADPFPGNLEDWGWVLKTLGPQRVGWPERHGMTSRGGNDDFWNFLIPGVGRAPVGGFQVLITLFAIAIGPVNYWLLRRRRQLYFLIVTVPLLAAATTVLLLGYAIASDGFAVRARVRSVTLLDQSRGESVAWSRVSYYAGVAPSGGLRFSPDTAVYPLDPPGSPNAQRSLDWTEGQHMTSGWLRSRTPTQLLTISYRQSAEQLVVATSSSDVVRITNHLGAHVRFLGLAGENGSFYATENLARGESARLEPEELADLHDAMSKLAGAQRLEVPAEITDRNFSVGGFGPRRFMIWHSGTAPQWQTALTEQVIQVLQGADRDAFRSLLQPRTYVAITDRPPTIEIGVPKIQDAGSFHVIVGSY